MKIKKLIAERLAKKLKVGAKCLKILKVFSETINKNILMITNKKKKWYLKNNFNSFIWLKLKIYKLLLILIKNLILNNI